MSMEKILELFTESSKNKQVSWKTVVENQYCNYLGKKCVKVRKSTPAISIGTCTVAYGKNKDCVIICPHRLLENKQIFIDCIHLLTSHEPGNQFHIIPEVAIPGGSVDYVLASVKNGKVKDFVGIELQTMDTTGSVWGHRQAFLQSQGVVKALTEESTFGMNWKMTAKTILVQMHHKVSTFETLNRHLVLVLQDCLMNYMRKEFDFGHISTNAKIGDSFHFHSYSLSANSSKYQLSLVERTSTDSGGIAQCLRLKAEAKVELTSFFQLLESKLSSKTHLII